MRFLLNEARGWTTPEDRVEENQEPEEPFVQSHKMEWQIKYRRIWELSMGRDEPPCLPCRPWCDNGNEYLWNRPGEGETPYHQPRVDRRLIPTLDIPYCYVCYTCMDHRKCVGLVCPARVLSCYYCNSEKGPLRVREQRRAKRVAECAQVDTTECRV